MDQRIQLGIEGPPAEAAAVREARRQLGRKVAVGYLALAPVAILINLLAWSGTRRSASLFAAVCAFVALVGLIRIRAYGERSLAITIAMVAYVLAWVGIAVLRF